MPRGLTELEGCVLATVRAKGACTPYAVRREFRLVHHAVLERQRRGDLPAGRPAGPAAALAGRPPDRDRRGGTLYAVTAAGDRAVRDWLGPPLADAVVGSPPDPIRTRVGFLGLLPPADRTAFLAAAAAGLRRQLARLAAETSDDPFDRLAARGSCRMTEARLAWLRDVAAELGVRLPPAGRAGPAVGKG